MVKYRIHIVIIVIVGLYLASKFLFQGVESQFLHNYFTDLLFVPLLGLSGLLVVQLIKQDTSLRISAWQIVVLVISVSLYFEWYLPNYSKNKLWYTMDVFDCLMYLIGGGIFLLLQRVLVKPTSEYSQNEKTHFG